MALGRQPPSRQSCHIGTAAGTPTRTVHGASALTSVVGECGLHQYKVGRTAAVTRAEASTPYDVIRENVDRGCHTHRSQM